MRQYHVVWLDDEFEKLKPLAFAAEENGILLQGFRSFEEGFTYLEPNIQQIDAVLLDARFFKTRTQVAGSEDLTGLSQAWARLNQLDSQRKLPRFILSGQTRYSNDDTFAETYGRHYRKQSPGDVAELWQEIKKKADQQPLTQLRHRYADAFAACAPAYSHENAASWLLEVLAFLHDPTASGTGEIYFNPLRKLVEALFHAAHRRGLLADECIPKGKINLRWASLFLSGEKLEPLDKWGKPTGISRTVKPADAVFPPRLAQALTQLLDVTNTLSHVEAEQRAAQNFLRQTERFVHTPYLLASLTYLLLDVLIWFRGYADAHPDRDANRKAWLSSQADVAQAAPPAGPMLGSVLEVRPEGYGFFIEDGQMNRSKKYLIPQSFVAKHQLAPGDRIRVTLGGPQSDGKPPRVATVERL